MKCYSEYKDSGIEWIGRVPMNWQVNRLKTICTLTYGDSLSSEDRIEGDIPVYGSNGIVGYHNEAITHKPCIVIGRKGSYGKVNFSETECFPIDTTYFVDGCSAKCDLKWLDYLLPLLELDKFSKDTGVPGLNREDAHNKKVPIPEIDIQKEVVNYLNRKTVQIDELINKKVRMIELLKEERMAVINQAVTKGLDLNVEMKDSGIEWLGKIPKHWGIGKIRFAFNISSGNGFPDELQGRTEGELPFYKVSDINSAEAHIENANNYVSSKDVQANRWNIIPKGSIVLAKIGAALAKNHRKVTDVECLIDNNMMAITPKNLKDYTKYYFYLMSVIRMEWFSNPGAVPSVDLQRFKAFFIPTILFNEQKMISDFLDNKTKQIDQQIDMAKKSIGLLKEYRTALISEAVTGKIDLSADRQV